MAPDAVLNRLPESARVRERQRARDRETKRHRDRGRERERERERETERERGRLQMPVQRAVNSRVSCAKVGFKRRAEGAALRPAQPARKSPQRVDTGTKRGAFVEGKHHFRGALYPFCEDGTVLVRTGGKSRQGPVRIQF